jgi:hypothetical protein
MSGFKRKKDTQILTLRFSVAIIGRLDRYVKRFQKVFPGISFQRTDAIRLFVERGLKTPITTAPPSSELPKPEKPARAEKTKMKKEPKARCLAKRKLGVGKPKPRKKR